MTDGNGYLAGQQDYCYNVYQGDNVALEIHDQNGLASSGTGENAPHVAHRYLYGTAVDEVLAVEDGSGAVRWGLADHEGTIRDVLNSSGQAVNHVKYNSFGKAVDSTAPIADFLFGFTGQPYDPATGMYNYGKRWYDTGLGRFASEDPTGFDAGDMNLYRYCGNNPLNNIDPDGLCWQGTASDPWAPSEGPRAPIRLGIGPDGMFSQQRYDEGSLYYFSKPQFEISARNPPWYKRAWEAVSPWFFPTPINNPKEKLIMETVHPAVVAGGQNSARFGDGALRAVSGAVGTVALETLYTVGVPYTGELAGYTRELTVLGASDMAASFGYGGSVWGQTLDYGNIAPSSARLFMEEVRNDPAVSPLFRTGSKGFEFGGDVSFVAAQMLTGTALGRTNVVGRGAPSASTSFLAKTGTTTPIPLHNTSTPWYKYLSPKYDAKISVQTQGRTSQQIARTWSHELQHYDDILAHPQITHLATKKDYFPGTGLARYWLEYRGYSAGGTLSSPLTPLRSFSPTQKAYLGYAILIFGGGGGTAIYLNSNGGGQ